ncbi:ester cyclase [Amycolatopsis suaedae]|uniref:Ester cyclase n=1 Tax=Amycolatopsis suaedae TaxID=2510978 RepID=A0A4Q7IZX7_9PSEU|nr:ester cyclase [Amycolatopsis suaedae]RZQ60630.1 ester cyclase [Amycolatopsis suaedae]
MTITADLRAAREALVREHMESENTHEFDTTLATFDHPRYEIVATGQVYDGAEQVSAYYARTREIFPDQRNELIALHHADDAVIAEFWLLGTHRGSIAGEPPTGKEFRIRAAALFLFEGPTLVCERVYNDMLGILTQIGLAPELTLDS